MRELFVAKKKAASESVFHLIDLQNKREVKTFKTVAEARDYAYDNRKMNKLQNFSIGTYDGKNWVEKYTNLSKVKPSGAC